MTWAARSLLAECRMAGVRPPRQRSLIMAGTCERNGVVFMQAPHGRKLAWIIERTAQASAAVFDAILMLSAEAQPEPRRARRRPLPPR